VPLRAGVPRLHPGEGAAGAAANLGALVLAGLLGAALLHLSAFHIRAGGTGAYLLAHCPWRLAILAVLLISLSSALLFRRELRALLRELSHLAAGLRVRPEEDAAPRRSVRLAGFFVALGSIQTVATALAMRLDPMRAPMAAGGHRMLMAIGPAFPLWLGQMAIASVLAAVLWRMERSVSALRRRVALLRHLIALLPSSAGAIARATGRAGRTPRELIGFVILMASWATRTLAVLGLTLGVCAAAPHAAQAHASPATAPLQRSTCRRDAPPAHTGARTSAGHATKRQICLDSIEVVVQDGSKHAREEAGISRHRRERCA